MWGRSECSTFQKTSAGSTDKRRKSIRTVVSETKRTSWSSEWTPPTAAKWVAKKRRRCKLKPPANSVWVRVMSTVDNQVNILPARSLRGSKRMRDAG